MVLGLAPQVLALVAVFALLVLVGVLVAVRQEQADNDRWRLVSDEVERLGLPEVRRLLAPGTMMPNTRYLQVIEEGLAGFRPRDRDEELQRQRLLQEVRLRMMP